MMTTEPKVPKGLLDFIKVQGAPSVEFIRSGWFSSRDFKVYVRAGPWKSYADRSPARILCIANVESTQKRRGTMTYMLGQLQKAARENGYTEIQVENAGRAMCSWCEKMGFKARQDLGIHEPRCYYLQV